MKRNGIDGRDELDVLDVDGNICLVLLRHSQHLHVVIHSTSDAGRWSVQVGGRSLRIKGPVASGDPPSAIVDGVVCAIGFGFCGIEPAYNAHRRSCIAIDANSP